MSHPLTFSLSGVIASYADISRIEEGPEGEQRFFTVVMRDGQRVQSQTCHQAVYAQTLQNFRAGWDHVLSLSASTAALQIKKLRPEAKLPMRSSEGASCFDLCAADGGAVAPGQRLLVKTGLQMAVPFGYEIQVRSRSGHAAKAGVFVLNSPGTVDCDYRGEVGVILYNSAQTPFTFAAGDRIAQMAVCAVEMCAATEVNELSETRRGAGGFGSTGVK